MFVVKSKTQEVTLLCAYILLLFVAAIVRDLVIAPYASQHIHGPGVVIIEPLWKILFWITPTFLYIWLVEGQNPFTYLKLTRNPLKGLLWGLYGCVMIAALEVGNLLRSHGLHFSLSTDTWVNVILLVGLMEEIPFRGFLFQKMKQWFGFIGSLLISSLLFVLIHLPLLLTTGYFLSFPLIFGLITIYFVGILACIVLEFSDSLWSSVIVHTFYNLLISFL